MIESERLDKELLANSIKDRIQKENLSDMNVTVSDKGVTITLSNIHFMADSAKILDSEKRSWILLRINLRNILDVMFLLPVIRLLPELRKGGRSFPRREPGLWPDIL